ncbi:serine/threonine-protein kinase [Streptomyces sp. SBC-4]|nr:serine/threonine-protein kinase [Streptomyces sp. SBC-4]MDV5143631.1 serine/threonine-protein kinase [Streptomyces sp. SBC-4]
MIGGRYRLVSELGSGGFGRVWKARDETLRIDVAVKESWLFPMMSEAEQTRRLARATREARNAARLRDHPNIVGVHDVVVEDGLPWIVMQLIDGCSLQERIDAQGPLSVEETAGLAAKLLGALGAAHEAGTVHRDVKPANVMLTGTGEVLLADFGIAVHHADTALTTAGAVIGSMEYMAPERARGTDGLAASDLFSLGVTLYQGVEGVSPFRRGTPTGCLSAVLFDEAPTPVRAGRLAPLIAGLLEKDPQRRLTVPAALAALAAADARGSTVPPGPAAADASEAQDAPGAPTATATRVDSPAPARTPAPAPAPAPAGASRRPGTARRPAVTGLVLLLCAAAAVSAAWLGPFGKSDDPRAACDEAFRAIGTFRRTNPSYAVDLYRDDPAATAAARRLATDIRDASAETTNPDVTAALGDYADTFEDKVGDTVRDSAYVTVVTACETVGSAPVSQAMPVEKSGRRPVPGRLV